MGQLQLGMEVFDLEEAHFVQYKPQTQNEEEIFDLCIVKREKNWLQKNLSLFESFWLAVEAYKSYVAPYVKEKCII